MSMFSLFRGICVVPFFLACAIANAGSPVGSVAGTGGATEATQWLNNAQLVKEVMNSAQVATTTVSQYAVQIKQYQNQLLNSVGIDPSVLQSNLASAQTAYNNLQGYRNALTNLNGSLQQVTSTYDARFIAAKLKNMSWSDYVSSVSQSAASGNEAAKLRLQNEASIMQKANDDMKYANDQAAVIPTLAQNQSIQMLNTQMNRLITQNAQMMAIMAKAYNSDVAAKENDENVKKETVNQAYQQYMVNKQAMQQRQQAELTGPAQ